MNAAPFRPAVGAEPAPGYRLEAFLGRGGFGEVWRASAPGGFGVAVKFLSADAETSERELEALRLLQNVRDSHLLSLHGVYNAPGWHILVMELADCTLADRLKQRRREGLPGVPREELLEYFRQAAAGLDFLNEPRHVLQEGEAPVSIGHGDVKPQNLLLIGSGVKLGDFGLLRALQRSQAAKQTGRLTPAYAAPEILAGQVARQSDQYSLAVAWCELRGGRLPFTGGPAQVMVGHTMRPPDLTMLPEAERPPVERALRKAPRDRWPDCRAFVEALRAAPDGPPAPREARDLASAEQPTDSSSVTDRSAAPLPAGPQPKPASVRADWIIGVLVLAALAALGLIWGLAPRPDGATPERPDKDEDSPGEERKPLPDRNDAARSNDDHGPRADDGDGEIDGGRLTERARSVRTNRRRGPRLLSAAPPRSPSSGLRGLG
jgi:serine/threonine protein kinase